MGKVKAVWASTGESGITGGQAGDQTGREVKVGVWYNFGQTTVLRCKSNAKAKVIAEAAIALAENPCIGYDQGQRTTLFEELKRLNWDYAKLTKKVETDCSAFAGVLCNVAGIPIAGSVYSGNIIAACKKSGEFSVLTASKYINSDDYLIAGDIVVAPGKHVIVITEDNAKAKTEKSSVEAKEKKAEPKIEQKTAEKTPEKKKTYFPMYIGTSSSIVDAINDIKADSSMENRKKIAASNGIENYSGKAEENLALLKLIKRGVLIRP